MTTEQIIEIINAARRLNCTTVVIDEQGRIKLGFPDEEASIKVNEPIEPYYPPIPNEPNPIEPKPIIDGRLSAYAPPYVDDPIPYKITKVGMDQYTVNSDDLVNPLTPIQNLTVKAKIDLDSDEQGETEE